MPLIGSKKGNKGIASVWKILVLMLVKILIDFETLMLLNEIAG